MFKIGELVRIRARFPKNRDSPYILGEVGQIIRMEGERYVVETLLPETSGFDFAASELQLAQGKADFERLVADSNEYNRRFPIEFSNLPSCVNYSDMLCSGHNKNRKENKIMAEAAKRGRRPKEPSNEEQLKKSKGVKNLNVDPADIVDDETAETEYKAPISKRAYLDYTCRQLFNMYKQDQISFNFLFQRSYVWEPWRKGGLCHTILEYQPIFPILARKQNETFELLDGKQRISTIVNYIDGKFAIKGAPLLKLSNGKYYDINGKKFQELPEAMQQAILDYSITFWWYNDLSDEEAREIFIKINSGKPMAAKDINRASCIDYKSFTEMSRHDFFELALTKTAKENHKQVAILTKMWLMLNKPLYEITFEGKAFNNQVASIQTTLDERKAIIAVLDKMYTIYHMLDKSTHHNARKKMTVETHMVSMTPFFMKAINEGISDEILRDFVITGFNTYQGAVSKDYVQATGSNANSTHSIQVRNGELEKVWNNLFAKEEEEVIELAEAEEEDSPEEDYAEEVNNNVS